MDIQGRLEVSELGGDASSQRTCMSLKQSQLHKRGELRWSLIQTHIPRPEEQVLRH